MWILTNHQGELLQKVIDYVQSEKKTNIDLDQMDVQEIRKQIRDENFKHHLALSMEFEETFEPLSIDVESVYKFYNKLQESNSQPNKQPISSNLIKSVSENLQIATPDKEIKSYGEFSDYIVDQILKLDDSTLISSWLVKNQSYSLILAEILDITRLLELLAREKYGDLDRLLIGWEVNLDEIKEKFAKDIGLLQSELG